MTKEELASKLNGVEYREELSDELNQVARESGLLVVYGGSDDLLYLGGVGDDEIGCYDGGKLIICPDGDGIMLDVVEDLEDDEPERLSKIGFNKEKGNIVDVKWCEEDGYSWTYDSKIPYSTFDVMEDGEKYCRGIVININDLNK